MYLRHTTIRKDGKTHTYRRLVRSVRVGRKVRQETVTCLGELDAQGHAQARALAESLCGRARQPHLFDEVEPEERVTVRLADVRVERGRRFGDVWLGWALWRALKLDELMGRLLPAGKEEVRWSTLAAVLVLARLGEPSSELHIAEDWFRQTALDDLPGGSEEPVNEDRLSRALDRLWPQKDAIETHLRSRLGELFRLDYDLLIYDLTSTYFEGQAAGNALAEYGHSRDKRSDCKQVCTGLVVTRDGMPLGYEVFAGNRADATTLEHIVKAIEVKYGQAHRIWVMDHGLASQANRAFLGQGRRYVLGTPRTELKRFERELAEESWTSIRDGLEVKLCPSAEGQEVFIFCRSQERRAKERAIHERFSKRIEGGLERLAGRLAKARKRADLAQVHEQIGRLWERNRRASGGFQVSVKKTRSRPSGLTVTWTKKPDWTDWATRTEGCYALRSNILDWSATDLWHLYMQLTQAEAAFRIHKSDLLVRLV